MRTEEKIVMPEDSSTGEPVHRIGRFLVWSTTGAAFNSVIHSGDPAVWHNRYPEEWARINREVIDETGLDAEGLFWSRSGYLRSPGYSTLFWVGDQLQTWNGHDGLRSAITGCLSGGLSGFSLAHSDIGGFDSITTTIPHTSIDVAVIHRSKDLLLRWAEHSALSPVMRSHQGIDTAAAWQINQDTDTLDTFRRTVQLYQAWAPTDAHSARTRHDMAGRSCGPWPCTTRTTP